MHTSTEKERKIGICFLYVFFIYALKICVVAIFAELREHLCHHLDAQGCKNAIFNDLAELKF